ncbi:MAG: pilin [Candidatus Saccharimonadales bacterium]
MKKKLKNLLQGAPLAALLMLSGVATTLVVEAGLQQPAHAQLTMGNGANSARGDEQPESLEGDEGIFKQVTNVLLFLIGAVSVIMLIYGGIRYTISGGDQGSVTAAKNTILYAIIGIIVALIAYAVVNFVIAQFAAN